MPGGWEMMDIAVKCRTLLLSRMWHLSKRNGTATAAWMKKWHLNETLANPLHGNRIPQNMAYLKYYAIDMAYVKPPEHMETMKKFKKRMYGTLYKMHTNETGIPEMRVQRRHPDTPWDTPWRNLHQAAINTQIKST
jgi:hypothetical protein